MAKAPRWLTFVHLPMFERRARGLLSDEAIRSLQATLSADPEAGDVIPGAGGVRKVRVALPGTGKSGGARVIYFYRGAKGRIYLLTAYAKSRQENLTKADLNAMQTLTALLQREP